MQPNAPGEGKLGKFTGRTVLIIVLAASGPLVWGQTRPNQNQPGADSPLQIQKPSVPPLQTQQLPAQLAPTQQAQGAAKPAATPDGGEMFLFPLAKGWKQMTADQQFNMRATQFFPEGQTPEKWEEMLRSRIFFFVRDAPLETFLLQAAYVPREQCDDVILTPVAKGVVNGYASLFTVRLCTRDRKTGQGEVAMIKVIQGRDSLYIAERMWRVNAYAKDQPPVPKEKFDQWIAFMGSFTVCDARDPKRPCPKQPPK